jgi:hypothetical protein
LNGAPINHAKPESEMPAFISVIGRLFENHTRPEPVHFHSGSHGRAVVCHDEHCGSPRLDLRDARSLRYEDGDLR